MYDYPRLDMEMAELAEAEAMFRFESGARAEVRAALGIECARLGGGVVLSMRDDPTGYWSKALGFGFAEPVTAELIKEICEFYRSRAVPMAVLQLAPWVLPTDWEQICAEHGLAAGPPWVKLVRDLPGWTRIPEPGLRVERVDEREARRWASVLMRGFGMPQGPLVEMAAAAVGRPGFHAYAIRFDGKVTASAGMYVDGDVAQLFGAATLPSHRRRGAQSALLRARIRDAWALGCRLMFAETAGEQAGAHNSSLHNMLKAGFERLYVRQNWTWQRSPAG
ncbi:GNAT family N-acetyltransferase [Nonomuraea lactucae]|uniref:GNAT family N-acetyltransferase n=1 Tax=Nonomuraea lactucae TaxID=2249762 RepID=UPI001963F119|nr:GNAT family N-acetyltransferase [Nonomuraea lactucae]